MQAKTSIQQCPVSENTKTVFYNYNWFLILFIHCTWFIFILVLWTRKVLCGIFYVPYINFHSFMLCKFSFIHATTTSTTTVSTTTTTTTTTLSMDSTGGDFGLSGLGFGFGLSGRGFGGGLGVGGLLSGASMNCVHDQGCPSSSCQTSCWGLHM